MKLVPPRGSTSAARYGHDPARKPFVGGAAVGSSFLEIADSTSKATAPVCDIAAALGPIAWSSLTPDIRRRMSAHDACFVGTMERVEWTRIGQLLAYLAAPFGRPLALSTGRDVPVRIRVSNAENGGTSWIRDYFFPGKPCTVQTVKRTDAAGMLVECLGGWLQMHLELRGANDTLVFESGRYSFGIGAARVTLPRWLSPGRTTVRHVDLGDGTFSFELLIDHPRFGRIVYQYGRFGDLGG